MALELHAHSLRLIVISVCLLVAAVPLSFRKSQSDTLKGFGLMLGIWSLIDIVIGLASLNGSPPSDLGRLVGFIKFNVALDFGYAAIGGLMIWRSAKSFVKGMGGAVIIQGLLLVGLDAYLLLRLSEGTA